MYRTHRCSVHVASCVSIYGYGTPPPQDRARTARGLMYFYFMYIYVHEVLFSYYLYECDGLGGLLVSVLSESSSYCSPFFVVSPASPVARPGDSSSVAAGRGVGDCPARSLFCVGWVGDGLSSVAALLLPPSVAGLAGSVFSALPVFLVSSALLRTAERSSGCRSL